MSEKFSVVRFYFNGGQRVIKRGLTLEQAQAHCQDKETSSRTATSKAAKARTKKRGPWFDGYQQEK